MLAKCSGDSSITYYRTHLFHNHSCFHIVSLLHSHCGTARADLGHTLRALAGVLNFRMLPCASLRCPPLPASQHSSDPHGSPAVPHHPPAALHIGWIQRAVLLLQLLSKSNVNWICPESRHIWNASQPLQRHPGLNQGALLQTALKHLHVEAVWCGKTDESKAKMSNHVIEMQGQ